MDKIKTCFGRSIYKLRKELGLTQKALGEKLETTKQNINNWEKCISTPSADTLVKISEFFHVPIDFLLGQGIFENWEQIEENKEAVIQYIAPLLKERAGFTPEQINMLYTNDQFFKGILNALVWKIEFFSPSTGDPNDITVNITLKI